LHKSAYVVYAYCENNGLRVENSNVDKTEVFNALRSILATVGKVNGHKLYANDEAVNLIIGYSGRRANKDAPELDILRQQQANDNRILKKYKETNGVNPEAITELEANIDARAESIADLLATPDMRIKAPTKTADNAFRLEVEHLVARAVAGQNAKSWDELEAEEAERKARRNAAAKARRAAKKAAANA
jgi:hypothetical protein